MRLLFPFGIAGTFVLIQFCLEQLQRLVWRFTTWNTDVYLHYPQGLHRFLAPALTGFAVGLVFSAVDYALNRRTDPSGKTTSGRLLRYGARSGLCAIGFWLVWTSSLQMFLSNTFQHRRYHAYPPDMQWMNRVTWVLPFVFVLLLFWALISSLIERPTKKL